MIHSTVLWRRALFMAMMVEGAKLLPGTNLQSAELKRNHGSFSGKIRPWSRAPHLAADISTNHCLEIVRMVQLLLLSHKSTAVAKSRLRGPMLAISSGSKTCSIQKLCRGRVFLSIEGSKRIIQARSARKVAVSSRVSLWHRQLGSASAFGASYISMKKPT